MKHTLRIALGGLLATLLSCDAGPQTVLDSDIPQVPGMTQRLGLDIERSGGDLVGGVFVFIGPLFDPTKTMEALTGRFRDHGWTELASTLGFPRSSQQFGKGTRRVQIILDADQLEPMMSRAQYELSLATD